MAFGESVNSRPINAVIAWVLVGAVVLTAAESFLTDTFIWGAFSLLIVIVASLPALTRRDWTAIVPWPFLLVVVLAVLARTVRLYPEVAGYLALATLAIVIVVELVQFTPVELSRSFAVFFSVLTTLALEALWIIAQFYSDVWLGTEFLTTQVALQKDIVSVTLVGFAVGGFSLWISELVEPVQSASQSADEGGYR